jgi:3-oxoacyl-[acyl-carrier-protein] synthase III
MKVSNIYLSAPKVKFAENPLNNNQVLERVEENFVGEKSELRKIKSGISFVFKYCDTNIRYLGTTNDKKPLDYAIEASKEVCAENGVDSSSIDLVIYGGIYREYFEPATAMQIATSLGIEKAHVFDVTTACAGLLQSVNVAAAQMMADPTIKTALCCTTDFPDQTINYDIQSFDELSLKAAGLTLGSGAAAWILTREPVKTGSAKLHEIQNTSIPDAYKLCQVPVNERKFSSQSKEVFDLGIEHVPGEIKNIVNKLDWKIDDIDYFISHQPSKKIIYQICDILKIDHKKAPITHHLYGNTVNVSVPMTLDHILKEGKLKNGHKIIMSSAAAGFTMLSIAAEWVI